MTTTAFQYVFDNAENISIDSRPITSQTIARDFTVRTVVRNNNKKRFTVKLPDGMAWDTAKTYIEAIEAAGRHTPGTVTISAGTYGTWFTSATSNYTVICTNLPQWNVFARNQVSWSGAFEFIEYVA
jgi:hypothetical protein